jgi:DNA-binding Lrp family transcriptional regulator
MPSKKASRNPQVDERDHLILEYLIRDPGAEIGLIADQTGIPPSTVSKRIAQMLRTKKIERGLRISDWAVAGFPFRYRIELAVEPVELGTGNGGPIQQPRGKPRPPELPPLPPSPKQEIYSQEQLATYIKEDLPKSQPFRHELVVESVSIVLGREGVDLSVLVRARDPAVISRFVTYGLRLLGGVRSTITAYESWSC